MTDVIPNQLYPGGVMKQLGDLAGGIVYDQYAPGGAVGQLYRASGLDDPLDQYAPGGPLKQIEDELESEGGGGAPEGTVANFKDGVYAIDSVGVALGDMFVQNLTYGSFSPADVVAGVGAGGVNQCFPVMASALAASFLAGFVTTVNFRYTGNEDVSAIVIAIMQGTGPWWKSTLYYEGTPILSDVANEPVGSAVPLNAGLNTMVVVLSASTLSITVNGGTALTLPAPAAITPSHIVVQIDQFMTIEDMTFVAA